MVPSYLDTWKFRLCYRKSYIWTFQIVLRTTDIVYRIFINTRFTLSKARLGTIEYSLFESGISAYQGILWIHKTDFILNFVFDILTLLSYWNLQ